ncbi:phosphoglycerate kinase [Patescibacteria group bacterium]|nr:phosphoglycerate kinase [Patescibacteria group bacterium]
MKLKTYKLTDIKPGMIVLMRADLNIPLDAKSLKAKDNPRVSAIVSGVSALSKRGARVVIMSHLGRPGGEAKREFSLRPVSKVLARAFKKDVIFIDDYLDNGRSKIDKLENGQIVLLENLRFNKGEEQNQIAFAKKLASLGDIYINNAFGVCHRKHASVVGITKFLPSFAGDVVCREVEELSKSFTKPLFLLLGGVKLETKIDTLLNLAPKAEAILVGGGSSIALLGARLGKKLMLGSRSLEAAELKLAKKVLDKVKSKIVLPIDFLVCTNSRCSSFKIKSIRQLKKTDQILDIGPETIKLFSTLLLCAKTIIWNGPVGYIEKSASRKGTVAAAKIVAISKARTIVGGGETVALLEQEKLLKKINFVSSGGGAMLVFLGGKPMPGLNVLKQ